MKRYKKEQRVQTLKRISEWATSGPMAYWIFIQEEIQKEKNKTHKLNKNGRHKSNNSNSRSMRSNNNTGNNKL